jgi:hypothetical protein
MSVSEIPAASRCAAGAGAWVMMAGCSIRLSTPPGSLRARTHGNARSLAAQGQPFACSAASGCEATTKRLPSGVRSRFEAGGVARICVRDHKRGLPGDKQIALRRIGSHYDPVVRSLVEQLPDGARPHRVLPPPFEICHLPPVPSAPPGKGHTYTSGVRVSLD